MMRKRRCILLRARVIHRGRRGTFCSPDRANKTNPQTYPQTQIRKQKVEFNLPPRRAALSSLSDRAFGSAECDDRQGQIGLGAAAATGGASCGGFDPGSRLRVAAPGTWRAGASSPVIIRTVAILVAIIRAAIIRAAIIRAAIIRTAIIRTAMIRASLPLRPDFASGRDLGWRRAAATIAA